MKNIRFNLILLLLIFAILSSGISAGTESESVSAQEEFIGYDLISSGEETCIPPNNLVGWWPLDGTGGTFSLDLVNENHGENMGYPLTVSGKVDGAISFDGQDDRILVNSIFPFHQPGDVTLDFWLKVPNTNVHQSIFWTRLDNSDINRFNIFVDWTAEGSFGFDYRDANGSLHIGAGSSGVHIPQNEWIHIAITRYSNSGEHIYRTYINGQLMREKIDSSPYLPTAVGWQMSGRDTYQSLMFEGLLDEVTLHNKSLTIEDIKDIYNASSLGKCKSNVPITDCPADFEPDGDVDHDDLYILASDFGKTVVSKDSDKDLDMDGLDLWEMVVDFGRTDCMD